MTAPSERHAKSQVPLPTPDGNGEFHSRPRLPSGEPEPEVITAPLAADYTVVPAALKERIMEPTREQEIQARVSAATPEPWAWGIIDPALDPIEQYRAHLAHGSGDVHVVWCPQHPLTAGEYPRPDHAVLTAITGNGPTSEANAKLICAAPGDLQYLLGEVDRLARIHAEKDSVTSCSDYAVIPAIEPTPAEIEIERVVRARVAALPRGNLYADHCYVGPYLLVAERTLLEVLGVDVSNDPMPVNPFTPRERHRFQRVRPETEDDA